MRVAGNTKEKTVVIKKVQEQVTELRERRDAGAESLGELVWWSFTNVSILQADVEKIVTDLEIRGRDGKVLPTKKLCPQLSARGSLMKTFSSLGINTGSTRKRSKKSTPDQDAKVLLARRLDHSDDSSIKAGDFSVILVEEKVRDSVVKGKSVLDHHEAQRVTYSVDTKGITLETDLLEAEIRAGFAKYGKTYRSHDVATIVQNLIKIGHGITARESGGVYFIPRQYLSIASGVEKLCAKIDGASFMRWPVLAGDSSSPQVVQTKQLAGAAIRRELEDLQVDLEEMKERAESAEGSKPRGSTIRKRLDSYKVLREKAITYRSLLGLEDNKLRDQINAMTRAAKALLEG